MKKRRLNEKSGGGSRIGLGGINSTGPYNTRYKYDNPSGYHTGGMQGNADSIYSQRQSLISTLEENEEEQSEESKDMPEEKESLYEFFNRIAKLPLKESKEIQEMHCDIEEGHCKTHESHCTMSEMHCDEALRIQEENALEEMSAGGVAGVAGKFGLYNADGTKTSHAQYKKQKEKQKKWK